MSFESRVFPSLIITSGLSTRPALQLTYNLWVAPSSSGLCIDIPTCGCIFEVLLNSRIWSTRFCPSLWNPINFPSTNTLVPSFLISLDVDTKSDTPMSNNFSTISSDGTFWDIIADNAKFFTRPQFEPSGVSLGQILPKCVECRSLASKFGWVLLRGDCTLLKWLIVER